MVDKIKRAFDEGERGGRQVQAHLARKEESGSGKRNETQNRNGKQSWLYFRQELNRTIASGEEHKAAERRISQKFRPYLNIFINFQFDILILCLKIHLFKCL